MYGARYCCKHMLRAYPVTLAMISENLMQYFQMDDDILTLDNESTLIATLVINGIYESQLSYVSRL